MTEIVHFEVKLGAMVVKVKEGRGFYYDSGEVRVRLLLGFECDKGMVKSKVGVK